MLVHPTVFGNNKYFDTFLKESLQENTETGPKISHN